MARRHVSCRWNGGYRCERCFRWSDELSPDDVSSCDLLAVDAWTISLSHPGGYGRPQLICARCGDELPPSAEAGERVATTIFRNDPSLATLLWSASYEPNRLEESPRCTGLGSASDPAAGIIQPTPVG